jgi:glyceraldehyde 3-phosphate dehydrogenase
MAVDIALECTGLFTSRESAAAHLEAGARKVLVSAPCEGADKTIVFGVNHESLTPGDLVVSNGSCTTNCLATVAKVLLDHCGVERGYMTTVHAYTSDQPTQDTLHRDLYRARAAGLSMIPTSTGAAKALGLVLPELAGKLDGSSIRVPTANVSVVDLKIVPGRAVTREEINEAMSAAAAKGPLRGVLQVTRDPLVSADLNHIAASATVALPQTQVIDGHMARVLAWYDNEWGFSTRMADVALALAKVA